MGAREAYEDAGAPTESEDEAMEPGDLDMEAEAPELDTFEMEARSAFDESLPMDERMAALKGAIMSCMGTDYGGEKDKKADSGLALIFGGKK